MKPSYRSLAALPTIVMLVLVIAASLIASGTSAAAASVIYVSKDVGCKGNTPCYNNVQDAIDAGTTVSWLNEDIDEGPRPVGDGYDIGADEYKWVHVHVPPILKND